MSQQVRTAHKPHTRTPGCHRDAGSLKSFQCQSWNILSNRISRVALDCSSKRRIHILKSLWIEVSDRLHQYTSAEERQVSHADFQVMCVAATPARRWGIAPTSEVWAARSMVWDCGGLSHHAVRDLTDTPPPGDGGQDPESWCRVGTPG